jgi:hypothetical protein
MSVPENHRGNPAPHRASNKPPSLTLAHVLLLGQGKAEFKKPHIAGRIPGLNPEQFLITAVNIGHCVHGSQTEKALAPGIAMRPEKIKISLSRPFQNPLSHRKVMIDAGIARPRSPPDFRDARWRAQGSESKPPWSRKQGQDCLANQDPHDGGSVAPFSGEGSGFTEQPWPVFPGE